MTVRRGTLLAASAVLLASCGWSGWSEALDRVAPLTEESATGEATSAPTTTPSPRSTADPTPTPTATPTPTPTPATTAAAATPTDPSARVEVRYRVERRVVDEATAGFAEVLASVLTDPRGWTAAGYDFVRDDSGDAPYRIVLAEGDEVDALCRPYDTYGTYSCQNGPVVALNADRWRTATPQWTGSLADYRIMLVNHEVGHLIHLHHPRPQCPGDGYPMPVMSQQSTELGACTANPWPLRWELALASEHREPLAPPADHDASDHRPSPPPEQS